MNQITKKRSLMRAAAAMLLVCASLSVGGCGQKQTEHALAYRKIGVRAMEKGDYDEALKNFQLALDQSKGKVRNLELDICMNKAEAFYRNDQPEEAIAVCDAVISYDKSYASAYYVRGNLYLQKGDTQKALADYEQAANHAGDDAAIFIQIYENLKHAGRTDAGAQYLEQALKLKGNDRAHLANRGYVYYLLGDYESAQEQLTQAVALEKKEGEDDKAELYLAQTYEQTGDTQSAEKYYELYAKDHADDAAVLEELGNMAMGKEDYAQALTYYQKGLATQEPLNEQKLRRGEIAALEQLFEFEQAKEKMAQYVSDYPNDEEAAREYLFLKTRGLSEPAEIEGDIELQ